MLLMPVKMHFADAAQDLCVGQLTLLLEEAREITRLGTKVSSCPLNSDAHDNGVVRRRIRKRGGKLLVV